MLSICIPTYNRADLLERSLKHLLTFSKLKIEVCVSNNNSSDDTLKVINKYKTKFKKFNHFTTTKTTDMLQNFDLALKLATQKYTIAMPDDDLANEYDLLLGIALLEKNKKLVLVVGGFKKYNLKNELLEILKRSEKIEFFNIKNAHLLLGRFVSLDLPIFKTELLTHITNPHPNFSVTGWEFYGIALTHGDICVTPYSFFNHYSHKEQHTNTNNNTSHLHYVIMSEAEIFLGKMKCSSNEKFQAIINYKVIYYRYMMWNSYQNSDFIQARWAIKKGIIYSPNVFEPYAKEWDQKYLMASAIQDLNYAISAKPHVKRVLIYSTEQQNLDFLYKQTKDYLVIKPKPIKGDCPIDDFDKNSDFIIFFNEKDMAVANCGDGYNSDSLMRAINALKFTTNKITFNMSSD